MRSFIKDKVKSGVEKVKQPLKDRKEKKEAKRQSKLMGELSFNTNTIEENKGLEESEEYKRKKERAARIRETEKIRHSV